MSEERSSVEDPWPLGINPELDEHCALRGLPHWSCVSKKSNQWWCRQDGCEVTIDLGGDPWLGYSDQLIEFDDKYPMGIDAQRSKTTT